MPTLCVYNKHEYDRIVAWQFGVIARDQATACGITAAAIDYRLRLEGPWRRMLPGVYSTTTGTATAMQWSMAALLYAGPASMITGQTAVHIYGLLDTEPGIIDVLADDGCQRKSTDFVRLTRTIRMPGSHTSTGPLRYAPAPRAIADAARGMTSFGDVQTLVCRSMQKNICTLDELTTELSKGPTWGSRMFREAVCEASAGIWSKPEGDLKKLIDRSGVEQPIYNALLYAADGTFLGCADAWWARAGVAAEVDSREHHMEVADYEKTWEKHKRMTDAGIDVRHWMPRKILRDPDMVIAELKEALRRGANKPRLPIRIVRTTGRRGLARSM
jgi:hypothetical protein